MGQKVNPHGLRVGVIKKWDSRWLVSDEDFGDTLVNDYHIRDFLKKRLSAIPMPSGGTASAGIPKIEIERSNSFITIVIYRTAHHNVTVGRSSAGLVIYRYGLGRKYRNAHIDRGYVLP